MFKVGNVEEGRFLYQEAIDHFGTRNSQKASALAKFFYAENMKGIDDRAREKLLASAASIAKRCSMRELLCKDALKKCVE